MEKAQWYYDLISPFSYLHLHRLRGLRERLQIEPVPVLFAGLLKHWGSKGPAEIGPKRLHTYQHCVWVASQMGVPFRMPPRHPFNPLASQRLLLSLQADFPVIEKAFGFVFGQGRDPDREFEALASELQVPDAAARVADPKVKQQLLANTERAIQAGVFGVPTLALRGRLFWGSDTVEWATRFLDEPTLFDRAEYDAAARSEFGVARS
jgi:2-hydroxychromene-2-carboxylate isomerase